MQAAIHIRVPHVRDSFIVADVARIFVSRKCPYKTRVVILSAARSAESKDLRFSFSYRRTC